MERPYLSAGPGRLVPLSQASGSHGVRARFIEASGSIPRETLGPGEVHLWHASLDLPADQIQRLHHHLSEEELHRVSRFRFEGNARRFVAARGLLRSILSGYTGTPAGRLRFTYGPHGKPALIAPSSLEGPSDVRFNLSHSGDAALYAFARGRDVGIDLERLRAWPQADSIVEHYFTPREGAVFRALQPDQREQTFFRWWTRKEAYIKATGDGHAHRLDTIDVLHGLSSPAWLMCDLHLLPSHCAAVVLAQEPSIQPRVTGGGNGA